MSYASILVTSSFLLVPLVPSLGANAGEEETGRLTRGQDVDPPNKYPMLVHLYGTGAGCSGTILDRRWVITAAWCVFEVEMSTVIITAGDYDQGRGDDPGEQIVRAVEVRIHDAYREKELNKRIRYAFPNNIALVRVHPPFVFNKYVTPVNLPDISFDVTKDTIPRVGIIAGWGLNRPNTPFRITSILQEGKLQLRELDDCRAEIPDLMVTDSDICAGPWQLVQFKISYCFGDEGGPLLLHDEKADSYTQIGLYSYTMEQYGIACGVAANIFMSLSKNLCWIKDQLRRRCERQTFVGCLRSCGPSPSLCCDKVPRRMLLNKIGSAKGICVNRTIARNCIV